MTFKNNDLVRYTGEQTHLKDKVGIVKRDTVAPNGNILVHFHGKDKPTVINPKNLTPQPVALSNIGGNGVDIVGDVSIPGSVKVFGNPKDVAVGTYQSARSTRDYAVKAYNDAKQALYDLGLINDEPRAQGTETVYESQSVRLDAQTAQGSSYITMDSLQAALRKTVTYEWQVKEIMAEALKAKKPTTTYVATIK